MNISSFFERKRENSSAETADSTDEPPKKISAPGKSSNIKTGAALKENTAQKKTVLKWQKEFSLDLQYRLAEGNAEVVEQIWCQTCRDFSTERSSSVSDIVKSFNFKCLCFICSMFNNIKANIP